MTTASAELDTSLAGAAARRPRAARSVWRAHPVLASLVLLTMLSIAASAWEGLRIPLGPLSVHPFMVPAGILFVGVALPRLGILPLRFRLAVGIFFGLYMVSMLPQDSGIAQEAVKLAAFFATLGAVAASVYVLGDGKPAVLGLSIGIAIMAVKGLLAGGEGIAGINPMGDLGNKNAYSVYALPAIALGGFFLVQQRTAGLRVRLMVALATMVTSWAIFATGNRSGWLGVVLIAVLLGLRSRGVKTRILLGVLVVAGYLLVTQVTGTEVIEHRVEQTQAGYHSDESREDLMRIAIEVGLENPMLGASPMGLYRELARRTHASWTTTIDPHNVFTHIFGASGIFTFLAFLAIGWTLCTKSPARRASDLSLDAQNALGLLRLLTIVFIVRGMFSRELIYNPAVASAFGVGLGLALSAGLWRRPRRKPTLASTPAAPGSAA